MDYTIRYGLEFNPFLKNSKEIFVSTDESKEVLFRLDYLAKTKGFGLLTGSPGRGKTTAIRKWVQTLNNSQYKVVYTCFSTFSPNDFYRNLATELGAQAHYRKPDNFRVIQEELTRLSVEKRKTPVIIIDEANYISSAILNDSNSGTRRYFHFRSHKYSDYLFLSGSTFSLICGEIAGIR